MLLLLPLLLPGALAWLSPAGALAQDATAEPDAVMPSADAEQGDALERARDALEAGAIEDAIDIASAHVARTPEDADGWTVLGLAHFAAADNGRALAHFDRALSLLESAGAAQDAAFVRFNRAACIFALGDMVEAERAFVEAGRDQLPPLSVLSAVNAGLAALELGASDRAQGHLARADALDVDGDLQDARQALREQLDPDAGSESDDAQPQGDGPPSDAARQAYEAGVEAHARGERARARARFRAARARGLDTARDENAVAYLDALAGGLRSIGRGWGASVSLGVGYDDNVAQSGIGDASAPLSFDHAEQGSALLSLGGEVGYGFAPTPRDFVLVEYSVDQLAYTDGELDVFNSQDHVLELGVEHGVSESVRLGVAGRAVYAIAGLQQFEPLTWTLGGEGWGTLEYADHHESTLRGTLLTTRAIDDAFHFLQGTRVEAGLDQLYRRGRLRAGGGARYRVEGLGEQTVSTVPGQQLGLCDDACRANYGIPLSYRGPGFYAWLSLRLLDWLRVSARGAAEWRRHTEPSQLEVVSVGLVRSGVVHERTQRDRRIGAGGGVTFDLGGPLELYLGYQLNVGTSNVDNTAGGDHVLDYGNLNYTRQLVELELGAHF